jgi:hypothetical protein
MALDRFRPTLKTHDLVQDLKWDAELRHRFERDETSVLDAYDLLPEERAAIERRDFKALYDLGVHQYLLAQLARLVFGTAERAGTSEPATMLVRSLTGRDPTAEA